MNDDWNERGWSERDYESVLGPPKYIRDYLVLSRDPRNDRLISTFAKVPLALGHGPGCFIIAKGKGEKNSRTLINVFLARAQPRGLT